MGDPSVRVPDGIEPISAYRAWVYSIDHGRADLYPLSSGGLWISEWKGAGSGWVSASCQRLGSGRGHDVPEERCTCGFYSLKDLDAAIELASPMHLLSGRSNDQHVVLGRILLSGKVIDHEAGYRAERARIAELIPIRGTERSVMMLANRLGLGIAAAVEPRSRADMDDILRFLSPPPSKVATSTATADAQAHTVLGILAALFLLTAFVLLIAGVWRPPLGLLITSVLTVARSADPAIETCRERRGRRRHPGRLKLVPPLPSGR